MEQIPPGASIGGTPLSAGEIKDLNRGRTYLHDVARRHKCVVFSKVEDAVEEIVRRWQVGGSFEPLPQETAADVCGT